MDWNLVGYVLAAIVGGAGSWIKTNRDAAKRGEARNDQIEKLDNNVKIELEKLKWRMVQAEKKLERIDDIVEAVHGSNERLAKIEGLLEVMARQLVLQAAPNQQKNAVSQCL